VFLISCRQDEVFNSTLLTTWEAKNFISLESVAYPKNENIKILVTFDKSGRCNLKLDINICTTTYTLLQNNQIEIGPSGCSKACCDSGFSQKLVTMLSQVTSYTLDGKTLKLNVPQWGYILLDLAN
jgi:hypothetical protein